MMTLEIAHARLVSFCGEEAKTRRAHRENPEDPSRPETIQAMQIALNLPKTDQAPRSILLAAAARAVVAACLDPRAGEDSAYAAALEQWYGHRIRKVARRARNKAWLDVQMLPGVTVDNLARAFAPSAVNDVEPLIAKLQITGTDLAFDDPEAPDKDVPIIYVDAGLGMSLGKVAAQVGHASMLLAARRPLAWVENWAEDDFELSVREVPTPEFVKACQAPDAVVVTDAGFTEIAPNTDTVVALDRPIDF